MGGKKDYELLLEIGHRSAPLKKVTDKGYTHKWTVYLKGVNDTKIEHCIQRVVFQLHESFDKPYRVIAEPPYQVKETGYAGFDLPIEVYFKNRDKPNHVTYTHNMELMPKSPHAGSSVERVLFINPNKDFEKRLIKAGAQLHSSKSKSKKERSETPPSKKPKLTSIIPSKDMDKLNLQPQSNGTSGLHDQYSTSSTHHNSHSSSSQQSSSHKSISKSSQHHHSHKHHNHSSKSGSISHNSNNINNGHNNQQQKTSVPAAKPESSNFMDLFGAPLVYSKKQKQHSSSKVIETPSGTVAASPKLPSSVPKKVAKITSPPPNVSKTIKSSPAPTPVVAQVSPPPVQPPSPKPDPHQLLQSKISALTDSDRLQQIVDIIEKAGEWFNLTPKKFEFDLKRLNKKTIHKIEKCLHS